MTFSKPVLEFWSKSYYPLVPALVVGGVAGAANVPKAKRAAWTAGGLLLGVGIMLYSRKALGQPAFGGTVEWKAKVEKQIDGAKAGGRLFSIPGDADEMYQTSRDGPGAYYKTAYWMAVASRLEGPTTANGAALLKYANGNWYQGRITQGGVLNVGSGSVSLVVGIYKKAAEVVSKYATDATTKRIAQVLASSMNVEAIQAQKEIPKYGKGPVTVALQQAARGAVNPLDTGRAIAAGADVSDYIEKANQKEDETRKLPKWVIPVAVLGGTAVLGLVIYIATTPSRRAVAAVAA